MTGVVERLHGLLVEAVRVKRGGDPGVAPVTVAEIYQELVPYRSVRAALGLDMNADYEHALLRLLSGESELARLEPPTAREQLQEELESANPNVTLYRRFAACDVFLAAPAAPPDWVTSHLVDEEPDPAWEEPADADVARNVLGWSVEDVDAAELAFEIEEEHVPARVTEAPRSAPAAASARSPETGTSPAPGPGPEAAAARSHGPESTPARGPGAERPSTGGAAGAATPGPAVPAPARAERTPVATRCGFCDSELPRSREIRFCPYCGADQTLQPCPACGEAIEAGWAFCIACGTPADGTA